MRIFDKLDKRELELLEKEGMVIEDKEYNSDEINEMEDKVEDALFNNLGPEGESKPLPGLPNIVEDSSMWTPLALEWERIHDKFIDFSNMQFEIEKNKN